MLATGRKDGRGASERGKNGRNGATNGAGSRFEVLGRAGEGTLWITYRVKERATGQVWALKALKGAFNRHPRFPVELLASCGKYVGLEQFCLAAPREVGQEDGTLFFTGEWLSGGSLETRLARALSRDDILLVLRACGGALAFLHERGLLHGDLRPRQLLYDAGGTLKLTDVGVAEAFAASGLALADVQPDAAWYLAPERTQGAALAPGADIYALGVILYRMLAGRVPFDGPSPLSIALRHRSDSALPPSHFNPRCPPDLEALALQLLEKDPARRMDAPALLLALQTLAPTTGTAPSSAAPITPATSAAPVPLPSTHPVVAAPILSAEAATQTAVATGAVATGAVGAATSLLGVGMPAAGVVSPVVGVAAAPAVVSDDELVLDREVLRKRHKRREFWSALRSVVWLAVALGAAGGTGYGAYYYWVQATPREVVVPKYLGLSKDEAAKALLKAGLMLRVGRETYDAKKPEGTVVSGVPEPGRLVRARREVTVTISQGEAPITMYDFSELPLDKARQIIVQHAMRLGPVVAQFHDTVPAGSVCGQYPEAKTPFRRSEPITLIVSRGRQPSEIDATKGEIPPEAIAPVVPDPAQTDTVPFVEAPAPGNIDGAVSRTAMIRVKIPANGGAQQVRIIVRDDSGERVVYSKTQEPGAKVAERVRVRHAPGSKALVRVYLGEALIKQQEF